MYTFKKYMANQEHCWYDSSNIIYSLCYDSASPEKTLKVVFKGGRTYLYNKVLQEDYLMASCDSGSSGAAFNTYIVKKYKGEKLPDTSLDELNALRESLESDSNLVEESCSDLNYVLEKDSDKPSFRLIRNGITIFEGEDMNFSIMRLLYALNIPTHIVDFDTSKPLLTEEAFKENPIV